MERGSVWKGEIIGYELTSHSSNIIYFGIICNPEVTIFNLLVTGISFLRYCISLVQITLDVSVTNK